MKKRKKIVNGLIIFMLVGILIIGSQYKSTKAGINDNKLNNSTVGVFIKSGDDYILTNDIPISGYEFNAEKSYCKIGEEIQENITLNYDMNTQTLTVSPIVKEKTKCYLYFDEAANASEILLANYPTVLTRTNFSTPITNTTTGTIYKSANESQYDDFGEVYYFARNPTDNWFYFGGYYWRIMRINGNGTIRLMYSGSDATGPVTTGEDVFIGTSVFNNSGDDNAYVGYMYTIGEQHGTERSSTIKEMIDRWYSETSGLINYEKYIDGSAGFCGDRTTTSNGTTYSTYSRFNSNSPSLICQNSNDLYTIKESGVSL